MDLANRAYKLRESPIGLNNNMVIRVGDIHMSFSVLHCIGKTVEGSGLDTCAIDSGTYSELRSGESLERKCTKEALNTTRSITLPPWPY